MLILPKPITYFSHEMVALQEPASGMQHEKACLEKYFNNKTCHTKGRGKNSNKDAKVYESHLHN